MTLATINLRRTLSYTAAGVLLLAGGLLLSSCDLFNGDFLDRSAKGGVSQSVLAGKRGGAESVLLGAYAALDGMGNGWTLGGGNPWAVAPNNHIYGAIAGGMAHKGSTEGDQAPMLTIARMQHDPTIGYFNSLWKARFEGVTRANSVLSLLPKVKDMSKQKKTRIKAEARFLRGHFYFDLKKNFGNVPWIDETTKNFKKPNTKDIWPKIEADFKFAMNNLPEVRSEVGRPNKWAAAAYLAKAYLYQEKWQKAASLFDRVINEGVNSGGAPYALVSKFQNMFKSTTENNSGTVFSIQQKRPSGSLWGGGSFTSRYGDVLNYPYSPSPFACCGFYQPTLWLVNSYRVGPNGLPKHLDPAKGQNVKNDQGVSSRTEWHLGDQPVDPRLDWTVGRRGVPFKDWGPHPGKLWVREQPSGGPFHTKKHIAWRSANTGPAAASAINYHIIRFADVLLMGAEAHAQLGNLGKARQYVNRVRERAANSASQVTNSLNKEFALAVVDSRSEMLATDASFGDWVVRTDRNSTFVFLGGDPGNIDDWNEYKLPEYKVSPYPASAFSSKQAALKRIRFERKLELALEGHRFYDIVRWGIADQRLEAYYNFETANLVKDVRGGDFTPNKNEFYPIPQRQIDLSVKGGEPTLKQNPGYQ